MLRKNIVYIFEMVFEMKQQQQQQSSIEYHMAFPAKGDPQSCLVEGCLVRAATRTAMRVHFLHQYVWDTVVILEEGNRPHPWCLQCDMLVPGHALDRGGVVEEKAFSGGGIEGELVEGFSGLWITFGDVMKFIDLVRWVAAVDDDSTAVVGNLKKVRKSWGQLLLILSR